MEALVVVRGRSIRSKMVSVHHHNNSIIIDAGTFSARFGFSGDDAPATKFQSVLGHYEQQQPNLGSSSASTPSSSSSSSSSSSKRKDDLHGGVGTNNLYPIKDGAVEDWDGYTELWRRGYRSLGFQDCHESSVIMTEKSHSGTSSREKMGEVFFESLEIPSLFIARDATLCMYACGRTTGLVIDCGASGTFISPVIDGWVESRGLSRSIVGGNYMDSFALRKLRTVYQASKSRTSTNELLANLEMARQFKESYTQVSVTPLAKLSEEESDNVARESCQLPDGTTIEYGVEKYHCAELIFDPSNFEFDPKKELEPLDSKYTSTSSSLVGIPKLASDSVLRCEVDMQLQLLANLVVVGGVSSPKGFPERLRGDIEAVLKKNYPLVQVKQISPQPEHRSIAAWLGGSILGSLGSIDELSVSKKEYEEYGSSIMDKKFP